MKNELSWIDVAFLLKEVSMLTGARINKIYQESADDFSFVLWKSGGLKKVLRIVFPSSLWIDDMRDSANHPPSSFSLFLRKRLEGGVISSMTQLERERVIVLNIESHGATYRVILEFFGEGNLIVGDNQENIEGMLRPKSWLGRTLTKGSKYIAPPARKTPEEGTISKYIASVLGTGKKYAMEICRRKNWDPLTEISPSWQKKAQHAVAEFLDLPLEPALVNGAIAEPVRIETLDGQRQATASFSEAIARAAQASAPAESNPEQERLAKAINAQRKTIAEHQKKAEEYEAMAKKLYEEYDSVRELLEEAQATRRAKKPLKALIGSGTDWVKIIAASDKDKTITIEFLDKSS